MRDLRKYHKTTKLQLFIGGILIIFVSGVTLIWVIYGINAALLGAVCFLGGLAPIGLIWIILVIVEKAAK